MTKFSTSAFVHPVVVVVVVVKVVCFIRSIIHHRVVRRSQRASIYIYRQRDETQGGKREEKEKDAKADATRWYVRKIIIIIIERERERESLCSAISKWVSKIQSSEHEEHQHNIIKTHPVTA